MRYLLALLIVILPTVSFAGEHAVQRGVSTKIPLRVDYMRETMIVLPERAVSVTGAGEPEFQVEPGIDYVMVRALKPNARGNLFINFGHKTIVSLKLSTVEGGGEQLVTLRYDSVRTSGFVSGKSVLKADLKVLAAPWKIQKLGSKSRNAGFTAVAEHALVIGDRVFVNFRVENDGSDTLSVSDIDLVRNTYGGLKGTTVIDTVDVPSECALDVRSLGPGEEAYGTLVFPKTYVDFDQILVLKIHNKSSEGPELRISL